MQLRRALNVTCLSRYFYLVNRKYNVSLSCKHSSDFHTLPLFLTLAWNTSLLRTACSKAETQGITTTKQIGCAFLSTEFDSRSENKEADSHYPKAAWSFGKWHIFSAFVSAQAVFWPGVLQKDRCLKLGPASKIKGFIFIFQWELDSRLPVLLLKMGFSFLSHHRNEMLCRAFLKKF